MKITIEHYGSVATYDFGYEDVNAKELITKFTELMVASGFPPSVIHDEDGHYEWVDNDKEV